MQMEDRRLGDTEVDRESTAQIHRCNRGGRADGRGGDGMGEIDAVHAGYGEGDRRGRVLCVRERILSLAATLVGAPPSQIAETPSIVFAA